MNDWKVWLKGLVSAAISAAATAFTTTLVDPDKFNLTRAGIGHLCEVCGVAAALHVAFYLKQSPLWSDSVTVTSATTTTQTVSVTPAQAQPVAPDALQQAAAPALPEAHESKRNPLL